MSKILLQKKFKKFAASILAMALTVCTVPVTAAHAASPVDSGGYARIRYSANNRTLDVPAEGLSSNGQQLQIWDSYASSKNQVFRFEDTGDGWKIFTVSDKVMEVRNSSHDPYAEVAQWDNHGGRCARWDIISNSDGTHSFRNKESGLYLNVSGGGDASNGTRMIQYYNDGTAAMRFRIEPVGSSGAYRVTSRSGLNVRQSPASWGRKIGAIPSGKVVTVTRTQDGWGFVREYNGWASMDYLKPAGSSQPSSQPHSSGFIARKSCPDRTNPYYFSRNNPFYQAGYGMPNCTAYAYGRIYEILDQRPHLSTRNAGGWMKYNRRNHVYASGWTPKPGAVAVWSRDNSEDRGHVAVVEEVYSNGTILISESHYGKTMFDTRVIRADSSDYLRSWIFQGYIYPAR